ncbi:unnamed protein product [Brugia timori]|uniref:Uma2 domain-containing protein n=1 Tax=Brugia timori TaxID=42155 RepID=A0A0R3Q3P8_9BILA|nr:unnamed protein product [Brugia timori]
MAPSWLFIFNQKLVAGNHSTLNFFPPIQLNRNKHYSLGLIYFCSFNTIQNVTKKNNLLHLKFDITNAVKNNVIQQNGVPIKELISKPITLEIPIGIYNSEYLLEMVTTLIRQAFMNWNEKYFQDVQGEHIMVKFDPSISRVFITDINGVCKFDFNRENSVGPLLGFHKHKEPKLKADHPLFWNHYVADNEPAIHPFNTVNIFCNLVKQSYLNGVESHILYSFPYKINPSQHIHECPQEIVYLPINTDIIREISLSLLDEYGNEIVIPDSRVIITLRLKEE